MPACPCCTCSTAATLRWRLPGCPFIQVSAALRAAASLPLSWKLWYKLHAREVLPLPLLQA